MNRPGHTAEVREKLMWRLDFRMRIDALGDAERAKALRADRALCMRDFHYWVDRHAWLYNPHALKKDPEAKPGDPRWFGDPMSQPMILWPKQVEIAEWVVAQVDSGEDDSIGAVPKARKVGITWTMMHLVYWLCWTRPGFSALLISRGEKEVDRLGDLDSLIEKMRFIHRHQPKHLRPKVQHPRLRFLFDNGSTVTGTSTGEGAGQGGRKSLVLIDEAARITNLGSILISTASVAPRVLVYNPGMPGHPTHTMHLGKDDEKLPPERLFPLDWHSDPARDSEWWDSLLVENGGSLTKAQRASSYGLAYGYSQSATIWEPPSRESEWIVDCEDPANAELLQLLNMYMLVGGLDYGSGASATAGVFTAWIPDEGGAYGTHYIIADPVWSRRKVSESATELAKWLNARVSPVDIVGDPTGDAPDAEQLSWAKRFRGYGVPVKTLPVDANKMEAQEWAISMLQVRLDSGGVKVLSTCVNAIDTINSWRRNLPAGITSVDASGRGYVPPVKDRLSHTGDCLCYVEQRIAQLVRARLSYGEGEDISWTPSLDAADIAWGGAPGLYR